LSTDTNKPDNKLVTRITFWVAIPSALTGLAFLKVSHDASLARADFGEQLATGCLGFLSGIAVLFSLAVAVWNRALSRPMNSLALVVGLTLVVNRLIPSLEERVASEGVSLKRLALGVRAGSVPTWPVWVGPFRFTTGQILESGVFLTTSESSGQQGLLWKRGRAGEEMNRWEATQLNSEWAVIYSD
jgi:hypothetical protein